VLSGSFGGALAVFVVTAHVSRATVTVERVDAINNYAGTHPRRCIA
jgi:hypothetical protein